MNTRLVVLGSLALWVVGCGGPAAPSVTPGPEPGPAPTSTAPSPSACAGSAPGPGFVCVPDCGPPVAREGDPPAGSSWLSAKDAESRKQFGCPICLPAGTRVATPAGERAVSELAVGDPIWTLDLEGQRVLGRVLHAGSTPISGAHQVVRVTLADGRVVVASPGHPTLTGRKLSLIRPGDALSGSVVTRAERVPFAGARTFDILPSGSTGAYWADGVVLRSSFWR